MLSYPVEQSFRKLLMIFRTYQSVVFSSNCSVVLFFESYVIVR